MADKDFQIRNSTIDFLIFVEQDSADSIQVRARDENVWLTQKSIAQLFERSIGNVSLHLKNIFGDGELVSEAVIKESSATAPDGKQYKTKLYNLDAMVLVGYRTNSLRATQFRQWAAKVLRAYTVQGYVLDRKRLEDGQIFDERYFEYLLDEVREVQTSGRGFYQKITDIYAIAVDYLKDAVTTREFFKTVQNKLHYAIHGHTATEVVIERADHKKEHIGLTAWKNAPGEKVVKADMSITKSYLSQSELQGLNQFVSMYLNCVGKQAKRHIPMTMEDWATKLEIFLRVNNEGILLDKGKVTREVAEAFTESEFEKYRMIQDQLYGSDFDRLVMKVDLQ